jgi:ubiquinone/menaquinone biosynthesis C-methylase UbiE
MMDYTPIAGDYDKVESAAKTLLILGYPSVTNFLLPLPGKKILDFGCGTGIFSRYLNDRGAQVTGVDISTGMIKEAKRNSQRDGITYCNIDPGDLSRFQEQSFDHVVSNFVFCAIPTENLIRKSLAEIFRILRNDGSFIMMNSNWERSNGKEFVSFRLDLCDKLISGCGVRAITKSDPPIIFEDYYRSREEYRSLMEKTGFIIETTPEPLANNNDSFWLDEKHYPPYFIIAGRKGPG